MAVFCYPLSSVELRLIKYDRDALLTYNDDNRQQQSAFSTVVVFYSDSADNATYWKPLVLYHRQNHRSDSSIN
jgi:hypothetical protein